MKNSIVKKIVKGLIVTTASVIVAVEVTLASMGIIANIKLKEYLSDNEIEDLAKIIDCDTDYLVRYKSKEKFVRMQHNGDEPIYVSFDEDFTAQEKTALIKSLETVFGVVSAINENYRFEIVDSEKFEENKHKSRIFFKSDSYSVNTQYGQIAAQGLANSEYSNLNYFTNKKTTDEFKITIDRDRIMSCLGTGDYLTQFTSVGIHELLHLLGFDDIYTQLALRRTTKHYGNAYINPKLGDKLQMLTPNDVKCLIALYAKKDVDHNKIGKFLEKYEKAYYAHYVEVCKEKTGFDEDVEDDYFEIGTGLTVTMEDGTYYGYDYFVEVEDGKYRFEIYDRNTHKLLESASGDVTVVDGVVILKDVELKKGLRPYDALDSYEGGFIQDLVVGKKDGQYIFYDLLENWEQVSICRELEKGMEQ